MDPVAIGSGQAGPTGRRASSADPSAWRAAARAASVQARQGRCHAVEEAAAGSGSGTPMERACPPACLPGCLPARLPRSRTYSL